MEVLISIFVCFIAILALRPVAIKIGLVDQPDARKKHVGVIPLIGGVACYIAALSACMLAFQNNEFVQLILLAAGLLVFLGVLDDFYDLPVSIRLIAQIIVACVVIFGADRYIHVLGDLLGFGVIDLGVMGIVFTVVAILAAINMFNMVDGIDGLAGSLAINAFVSIALLMYWGGNNHLATLPLILAVSLIPYLLFNLDLLPGVNRKIFMGDAGSMFIGLSVVCLLIAGTQSETPEFRPVAALWFVAIPMMDMTALVFRRIRRGVSPFAADRDHLHHIVMRSGCGPRVALLMITYLSIIYSLIGIAGELLQVPESVMFIGFLFAFVLYYFGLNNLWMFSRFLRRRQV